MSVHYKFKSSLDYDTVTFDGLHISVGDLKKAIIQQKRIGKNTDFDLQVTNAQTKEVYQDENALIPKNTSLIIARVPLAAQSNKGRAWNETTTSGFPQRGNEDINAPAINKAVDLSRLDASEEDKIRAMMTQSTLDYDPSNYMKIRGANQMGEVPANYRCYKCHLPGHWIKNCPLGLSQEPVEIKKSTGIPRSFMVPVEGPMVPGAMMTPTGQYAVPALDHQAYNSDGGGRGGGGGETEQRPDIPEDLVCSICKDLLTDAVMIPCCGNSFCDECIRTTLLESEEHECPDCHEKDISPGTLIPNRFLRNSVSNFKNETGYRKRTQYRHGTTKTTQVESTTEEKPQKIELPDFIPPPDDIGITQKLDQKPIISEADSTEQSQKQKILTNNDNIRVKTKDKEDIRPTIDPIKSIKPDVVPPKVIRTETPSYPQVTVNMMTGEVQPKVTSSQPVQELKQPDVTSRPPSYRPTIPAGNHPPTGPAPPLQQPPYTVEERAGTPTIDEPGVSVPPPNNTATTHAIPAYPPGDTPPFMSPPEQQTLIPGAQPPPGVVPNIRPPMLPPQHGTGYPPATGYPPQQGPPPPQYSQPYPAPPNVRRPPPPTGPDFNNHPRGYLPRMPYDQVRPPPIGYDGSRPPPPQIYQSGYPPRPGGPPMGGPRPPYGPPHVRNPPPGIRPPHHPTGVIDDPLAAFERMLREKDERDRRVRESRRSRSRSYSPRSRRTRSSSRSRSYSPRSRSPRSRSPPPKSKIRNRSRTPRSVSRSRSRSRGGAVLRRSRTPRSRDRSFSISRSRSYSRTPSPREYSPRRRPVSRGRYRSPPPKNTPPRYRYPDRRIQGDRDRGGYNPPPREREFTGSYYDGGQPPVDFIDRGDRAGRINEREKEFDRGGGGGSDTRGPPPPIEHRETRGRRGGGMGSRGPPRPTGGRYLPSPMRKEYPLVPQNQPTYYSVQEHAVYHHPTTNPPPNRLPPPPPVATAGPLPPPNRVGPTYPPALMSVKTAILPPRVENYEPPAPPGTEEPPVPGFESPRLLYDRTAPAISDAPPGVDPHAGDTVLTKPDTKERATRDTREPRDFREPQDVATREGVSQHGGDTRDKNRIYEYRRDRKGVDYPRDNSPDIREGSNREKHSKSPDKHSHRHRHRYESQEKDRGDRDRERPVEEKSSDKKNKDSSEDDKAKSKSREKKKKRKEKEKEREAEKTKKKEEKKKRKEQEKLEKIKKAEEKKLKIETENAERSTEKSETILKNDDKDDNKKPIVEYNKQSDDLYGDVLTDGIDAKVVQNYGKLKTENETEKNKVTSSSPPPPKVEKSDENEEKETSFDGLDLYVNENDILKTESDTKVKSKEVLAPIPALSKWEVEDEAQSDKKDTTDETLSGDKNAFEKSSNKIVTSEVLKHAENAIFKKAINAIRPIEIKKISLDRAKLYSGEKNPEMGGGTIIPTSVSPSRSIEKESITPVNIQVTIPTSDWGEMRLVDINSTSTIAGQDQRNRSDREIPSAVQKPAPTRLSVRERLGSKVDELDKLTKEDKHFDRNRSRTLSPLSRRERDETNRNVSDSTRRVIEVDERRHTSSRHNWNAGRDRKVSSRIERSRSRERNYRDNRSRNDNRRAQQYRRDDSRRDDRERRDRDYEQRHSDMRKKSDKRIESSRSEKSKDKEKERKISKYSRSRSVSRERKSSEKSKSKKKDKKHKKEKEKNRKHKKDDENDRKQNENDDPTEKEKKNVSENKDTNTSEKKITERRKPTLDEANFEPDYDALESDSDNSDNNDKGKTEKKRDRSRSNDNDSSAKKRKVEELSKKSAKSKEVFSSSTDSSSDSSSSEEEKPKKRHKKHRKRGKSSKKVSSSSSSNSGSDSSSDDESKKRRNKSKKHKTSKKLVKKKKKSKHR